MFDFFGFKCGEYDTYVLFTWGFLAAPNHPIQRAYLDEFKKNYLLPVAEKPLHLRPCWLLTSGSTLYDTGPYFYDLAYYMSFAENEKRPSGE